MTAARFVTSLLLCALPLRAAVQTTFDEASLNPAVLLDVPLPATANITFDDVNDELDFSAAAATDMWGARANAPIAWTAIPPGLVAGGSWIAETEVRLNDASAGTQVAGLTFYGGPDGARPDVTFGLDVWNPASRAVRLQGLGDNNPNAAAALAPAVDRVILRVSVSENGASDVYNFFYKLNPADAWTQVGGAALNYTTSFANSRVGLTCKTGAAKAGAAFTYFNVVDTSGPPVIVTPPASVSVVEPGGTSFSVTATGAATYQWRRNGDNIPGATAATYSLPSTTIADNGARFTCAVTNPFGTTVSNEATLTVSGPPPATVCYRSAVQAEPSLIAYFPMDGVTTTAVPNLITPANGGTISGTLAFDASIGRMVGTQAHLGNRNSHINLTKDSRWDFTDGTGTVEAWLYQTGSAADSPCFFAVRSASATRYSLHTAPGGDMIQLWNGSAVTQWPVTPSLIGRFVHVAVVFDGGSATCYVNGVSLGTRAGALIGATGLTAQIASSTPAGAERTQGNTDEVAIYSDALPASAIAAHYASFIPGGNGVVPALTTQPVSQTAGDGASVTFSVALSDTTGASYRWQRNGVDIAGANAASHTIPNAQLADNGAQFRCIAYNQCGGVLSNAATLTVTDDAAAVLSVQQVGSGMLLVTFNEPINPATGTWTLDNGVTVSSVQAGPSPTSYFVLTSTLTNGVAYTLTIAGVQDATGNPMTAPHVGSFTGTGQSGTPAPIALVRGGREPAGPATRRSGIVISEINYHPADRVDLKNLEFVELCNTLPWTDDLGGFRLTGEVDYTFPAGTSIPAGGYVVVAAVPADVQAVHALGSVLGPWAGALNNAGGRLRLRDDSGAVIFEVNYDSGHPWQPAADGAGHSLVLARASYGMDDPKAWDFSRELGGSPGAADPFPADPYRTVVINEIKATGEDHVELYNYGSGAVDVSGCTLSDDRDLAKFVIPPGTSIAAGAAIGFTRTQLGFGLKAGGDTVYFRAPGNPGRVLDCLRFGPQFADVAWGRHPDGGSRFRYLASDAPGTVGTARRDMEAAVISEIFYNPPPGTAQRPFVEITNVSGAPLDVGGWRLGGGVSYTIPAGTTLATGAALAIDAFSGSLNKGSGERLRLERPIMDPDGTGTVHPLVDEVTYGTGGRWGRDSDGGGSSLEKRDLRADGRLAANWADSDERAEAAWVTIERTGIVDNGQGTANRVEVYLLGAGEALVDDVEFIRSGTTTNLVSNPGFESGLTGWLVNGTHLGSSVAAGAGVTGNALHIRATGRGDLAGNKTMGTLTSTAVAGSTCTLRARVKYLRGHPEIVLRLHGGFLEATGNILGPVVCGTPGAANSRAAANAGPAITEITYLPVLPQAGETATVHAAVTDPDGTGAVLLNYRVDPQSAVTTVLMQPRGAGLFSGQIPAQANGTLVAFTITAVDNSGLTSTFPAPPAGEALIRWGETQPAGNSLTTYRLWFTQATADAWANRLKNSNDPLNATFVAGDYRVIHNAGAMYSGSPFHTGGFNSPTGNPCDYNVSVPSDDRYLGERDMIWAGPGTFASDTTLLREQAAWWIARKMGSPALHRRFVNVLINGVRRHQVMEDTQQPNGDFLDEHFPGDSDGPIYKAQDWIEYNDDHAGFQSLSRAVLARALSGGEHKVSTYRYRWAARSVSSGNDYTAFTQLVDAFNAGSSATDPAFVSALDPLVDQDSWSRALAIQRIVGNWDTWGWSYGKNMYAYKPRNGQWAMFAWDMDFGFGPDGSGNPAPDTATAGLFQNTSNFDGGAPGDPLATKFRTQPAFRRAYWCALLDAANGPMVPAVFNARMDLLRDALVANGCTVNAAQLTQVKTYVSDRRSFIIGQANAVFGTTTFGNSGGSTLTDADGILTLTGTAPANVKTFRINGVEYTPAWTSETAWSQPLTLYSANNVLAVQGIDYRGNPAGSFSVTITVTGPPPVPSVTINEWMADNTSDSGFADPADGQFEDWFELHNAGTAAVDLGGFHLSDTTADLSRFRIPAGTTIPAGGWLLVWADGEPEQNGSPAGQLHTTFRLAAGGDQIVLSTPDGTIVDLVSFGPQTSNRSEGRYPDSSASIVIPVPTPGRRNALPPSILSVAQGPAGTCALTVSTEPTHRYQVEVSGELGAWTPWGVPFVAAEPSTPLNVPCTESRRFWRVRMLP